MRTVQLITQTRGGPVDHAVDVARELARLGHDSHLVGPFGGHLARLAGSGVTSHVAAMTSKTDLAGARDVLATLEMLRPDVVHCQDRRAGLVGRLASRRRRLATVYTLHGVPDGLADRVPGNLAVAPETRGLRWANLTGERLLAASPRSLVVTPCRALATYATDHVGVPAERVRVVHNGIDPEWGGGDAVPPWMTQAASTLAAESAPADPVAAWLGVMQPVKRVPDLVHVVAGVPRLRLRLIGDGPERDRVAHAIGVTGNAERVEMLGFRSDPSSLLRTADLLVLPSAAEACPIALLQAMASGLPVVASRVGGVAEVVRDGVDGLLVPAGDDEALQDALRRLAADPAMRHRLGSSARERVRDVFSIERCTRNLLAVYEELA